MKRIFRNALTVAALLAAACMKDGPVAPHSSQVALHVQLQNGTPGEAIQVSVFSILSDSQSVFDTLFTGSFPVTAATQQVTAVFDLAGCLSRSQADAQGPYCTIQVTVELLNNGVVVDQRFLGTMVARPGQAVQTAPVVLVAGNNPPAITANDTARTVESGLIRYHITGADPDGDITGLFATDIVNATSDRSTQLSFFPPLRTIDNYEYAFRTQFAGASDLQVFLFDSKFNSSKLDTIPVSFANGDAFLDSMSVDTTADSLIVNARSTSDSIEVVVRNVAAQGTDSLYFVCGGKVAAQGTTHRIACKRQVPFTQAIAIAVPIDAAGNAGSGTRCGVPAAGCLPALLASVRGRRK